MESKNFISEENMPKIKDAINNIVCAFDGIELVDIAFYKEYGKHNLEVFLWKKEGISLNDCELVHNAVSCELDKYEDIFPDEYVLNVSSSGLDRKIVTNDDFRRSLDSEIECIDDKNHKVHGILKSYDDQQIVLSTLEKGKNKEITLQRNLMTKVQPYIRF